MRRQLLGIKNLLDFLSEIVFLDARPFAQ